MLGRLLRRTVIVHDILHHYDDKKVGAGRGVTGGRGEGGGQLGCGSRVYVCRWVGWGGEGKGRASCAYPTNRVQLNERAFKRTCCADLRDT